MLNISRKTKAPKPSKETPLPPATAHQEEETPQNPIEMLIASSLTNELEENGIIFISSEISKESMERACARLLSIHFDESWPDDREVQVILNSPGGHVDAGWQFIDLMDFVRFPIRTIAVGEIASMATMIFMSGDYRVMSHRSMAMIHHYSTFVYGNYADLIASRKMEDALYQTFIQHFIDNSKYTSEEQVRKHLLLDKDNWLTPQEMKAHGLCEEITPKKKKRPNAAKPKSNNKRRKK